MVLRVRLEIVPFGDETAIREIGRLDIFNAGHVDAGDLCAYGAIELTPKSGGLHLDRVYHYRNDGAWKLVSIILNELEVTGP